MKLKRILAMVLCVAMVLGTMSFNVFAAEGEAVTTMEALKAALKTENSEIAVGAVLTVAESETVALDLNGCTVNMGAYYIENKGTLTVENGTIIADTTNDETNGAPLWNKGTMTVDANVQGVIAAIRQEDGTLTVNGGNLTVTNTNGVTTNHIIRVKGGEAIVNGGNFNGNQTDNGGGGCMMMSWSGGEITINGGNFDNFNIYGNAIFGMGGAAATIKGGIYTNVLVEGTSIADCLKTYLADGYEVDENGSVVKSAPSDTENELSPITSTKYLNDTTIDLGGGTLVVKATIVANSGTVTIKNGTIDASQMEADLTKRSLFSSVGKLVLENVVINTSSTYKIKYLFAGYNTITVKNSTINAQNVEFIAYGDSDSGAVNLILDNTKLYMTSGCSRIAGTGGAISVTIQNGSLVDADNLNDRCFRNTEVIIDNSTVDVDVCEQFIKNDNGKKITLKNGAELTVDGCTATPAFVFASGSEMYATTDCKITVDGSAFTDYTKLETTSGKFNGSLINMENEDRTFISADLRDVYATKSIVLKIYDANDTLLSTTSLVDHGDILGIEFDSLSMMIGINCTDSYWDTKWDKLSADFIPSYGVLYIDDKEMNRESISMHTTSGEYSIEWKDVPGVPAPFGTEENPYLINNIDDLKWFRDDVNAGNTYDGMYIKLTADINLNNEDWTPIGTSSNYFKGMFDGDNHIISNLYINWSTEYVSGGNNQNYVGLFGRMDSAGNDSGIKNLIIENADVSGCLYVGAILGRGYTSGIIENCHVTGNVDIEGYSYIGGIVGRYEYSTGTTTDGVIGISIYNCSVKDTTAEKGTINGLYTGATYIGGILGFTTEPNPVMTFEKLSVENISVTGFSRVGGISGIAHQGNVYKDCAVSESSIYGTDSMVGLIVGACQGTQSSPVTFTGNTVDTATKAYSNETEVTNLYGTNISGEAPVTNYVAQVGGTMYENLTDALAAANEIATAENVVTVQLLAGELEIGNVLFPATINNVVIKGADNKATILKNSSLRSADGNSVDYQNITIDGIKFDNSYILFTGWRTNGVTYKDWTITNCEFYNITEEQAAVAFNLASAFAGDADEAMENFTFTNNAINGVTGEYKSGVVINAAEGDVLINNNVIKNVGWNAVQILNVPYYMGDNTDKSDKSTVKITNNVFENASADEGIINVYAPTDKGQVAKVYVNENKILAKNNTQPYICYAQDYKVDAKNNFWGIGAEGTAVIDLDYANKLIDVTGDKVGGSSGFNMPYYKTESMDELYWEAKIGDEYYATVTNALSVAKKGDTVVVLENATVNTSNACRGDITLDLNEKTLTVTNDLSAHDKTTLTIKNGTIDLGETGTISVGISDARFGYGVVTVSEDVVITGSGDVNVIVWNGTLNTAGVIENTGNGKAISGNGMWDTTEINITDGTVKAANDTAIYHPQAGNICVSGGSVEGDVAIVLKGGNLEISDGTLIADGEANEYSAVSSGYVLTGDALQIEHMDDSTDSDYYGTPTVSIKGGTFISENGNAVGSYANTDMEQIVDFISGGNFSNDVSDYVADGYELVANKDGTYRVERETTELFSITGTSTSLDSSLALNIYVASSNLTGENYYAVVEHEKATDVVETTIPYADWVTSGEYKVIRYTGIAAKEMTDKLTLIIYDSEGTRVSEPFETSLKAYALSTMSRFVTNNETNSLWLPALTDMLNYGAAAQNMFSYKTGNLASAGAEDFQQFASNDYTLTKDGCSLSSAVAGTTLSLEDMISLNVYFNAVSEGMYSTYSYTTHAGTVINETVDYDSFVSAWGYKGVAVPVAIADAETLITVTLFNSDNTEAGTAVFSVDAYLKDMIDSGKTDELYPALAKFVESAKTAFTD